MQKKIRTGINYISDRVEKRWGVVTKFRQILSWRRVRLEKGSVEEGPVFVWCKLNCKPCKGGWWGSLYQIEGIRRRSPRGGGRKESTGGISR